MDEKIEEMLMEIEEKMESSLSALGESFKGIRSGRSNSGLVEGMRVDVYGQIMPMIQLSTISCPDTKTIMIEPWDKGNLQSIEKAINASNIGITPSNNGNVIRLNMPALTDERRKEYIKLVKAKSEECKISVRNSRRDGNDLSKKLQKAGDLSEDEDKQSQDLVQKLTDKFILQVDNLFSSKEKELKEN